METPLNVVWAVVLDANKHPLIVTGEPILCKLKQEIGAPDYWHAFVETGPNDGFHVKARVLGIDDSYVSGTKIGEGIPIEIKIFAAKTYEEAEGFIRAVTAGIDIFKQQIIKNLFT